MVDGFSLSSPDLDSTSELLGNLDLIGRIVSDSLDMPDMDGMDVDLVLEVPDTPESVVRNRGSRFCAFNEDVRGLNSLSSDRRAGRARKTYGHQSRDSSSCDFVGTDNSQDETERLFRQARLARLLSEDRDGKTSHPTFEHNVVSNGNGRSLNHQSDSHSPGHRDSRRRTEKELRPGNEGSDTFHLKHADKGKGIVLSSDSKDKIKQTPLGDTHRNTGRRRLVVVHNGCTSPFGTAKSGISPVLDGQNNVDSVHVQISSSTSGISSRNVKKQVDVDSDSISTGQLSTKHSEIDGFPRRNGQRKLVRNGRIAPCNIKRENNSTGIKRDDFGCNTHNEGSLLNEVHVISPDSSDRCADKRKGKAIMDDNLGASFQTSSVNSQPTRFCSLPIKEVISGGNSGGESLQSAEDEFRRPAHNPQASAALSEITTDFHKIENVNSKSHETTRNRDYVDAVDGNPEITAPCSVYNSNTARELSDLVLDDRRSLRRHNLVRGKRKSSSIRANGGECSSSTADEAEVLFVRSSAQPTNQRSSRTQSTQLHGCSLLKPILEGDELDPANIMSGIDPDKHSYGVSEDSSAKARQVESDEILARQLQEQLFNESPDFEEMDATIALSLQQEENSQRAAAFLRLGQPHPRNNSTAPVYAPPARPSGRSASARPTARSRIPASSRMAYLRRSLNRPARDLESRLNFLEALEAEFDNRNRLNNVLQLEREFNENDYEMLLALDDNNEQAGASQRQINNLPQSVVQNENFEEACAVCLETPSIGDTIRHLPCLHKFHKDCIDSWLKRKTSCPICKCGIS